jgi:hypothetical protein
MDKALVVFHKHAAVVPPVNCGSGFKKEKHVRLEFESEMYRIQQKSVKTFMKCYREV